MKNYHLLFIVFCVACLFNLTSCNKQKPFPDDVLKIGFLGNSITYSGEYIVDLETFLALNYPDQKYELINLGLPSETVSGLSEDGHARGEFPRPCLFTRLDQLLNNTDLDAVFVCYGMNDGIYLPFDDDRFEKYKDGISTLYQKLEDKGIKHIYMMTPPIYDDAENGLNGYNEVLDKYSDWLIEEGKNKNWNVIDLHYPMKSFLEEKRVTDPAFKLAQDGVHPQDQGHWLMAQTILLYLGQDVKDQASIEDIFGNFPNADKIYNLIGKRQSYMKDAWLTMIGHDRPKMKKGLPIDIAKRLYNQDQKDIELLSTGKKRTVVSCIGNSITYGVGVEYREIDSYPAKLQELLGHEDYEVLNFGVSATTLLSSTDRPYVGTKEYQKFLKSNPDIVTIKLGTNDSRIPYREQITDSLMVQTERMIKTINAMPSEPRIIILLPATSYLKNDSLQFDPVIQQEIIPRLENIVSANENIALELLDIHTATANSPELFPDGLHPNEAGMQIIAEELYKKITDPNVR